MTFKNALCLAALPDWLGYAPWAMQCHRRTGHPGRHRVVYRDGGIREWVSGDRESVLIKEPETQ